MVEPTHIAVVLLEKMGSVAFREAMASFQRRRIEHSRDILLRRIRLGKVWLLSDDDTASAVWSYMRATQEGAARLNLELIADAMVNAAQDAAFKPDTFRYHAQMLAGLSYEEALVVAAYITAWRNHRDKEAEAGKVWSEVVRRLTEETATFPDKRTLEGHVVALFRTGWIGPHSSYGGLSYGATPRLAEVDRLVDFEAAVQRAAEAKS